MHGLHSLFAETTGSPIQNAFKKRGSHMPGSASKEVPEDERQQLFARLKTAKRQGPAVMYLHVPYCANHCLFCGFYRNKWTEDSSAPYTDALIKELRMMADTEAGQSAPINAVYFGGGTPTALHAKDLARLIREIRYLYPLAPDCEITVEGRIFHFDDAKVDACLDAGANRFSTGVQSFNTRVRQRMGRKASGEEARRFFESLRDRNRAAIVCDLILGLPYQDDEVWHNDLQTVIDLELDGVDLYTLAVFPGSPLSRSIEKGKCEATRPLPEQGLMYQHGLEFLDQHGWRQLSSSHWGRRTRERNLYNGLVKSGSDCLAFGSGSGGNLNGYSYGVTGDLAAYFDQIENGLKPLSRIQAQDPLAPALNELAGGIENMRLDLALVEAAHPLAGGFKDTALQLLENWQAAGLIEGSAVIKLTTAGKFWHQTLLTNLKLALRHHISLQPS